MTRYPRIYLAIDNSFATKRWTRPCEWAKIIRELGVSCVEASADTEADPFYCGEDYLTEWIAEVRSAVEVEGLRVANFYTGYTTYRTLGLAHPDFRVRARIVNGWLKVMIRIASTIKAGAGFFIHAISESALQDPAAYAAAENTLYDELTTVARFAHAQGPIPIVLEQMYTPHQPPWTIPGTERYMREVARRGGPGAYVAMDTGHQTGQRLFLRPDAATIRKALWGGLPEPWLGPESAFGIFRADRARGGEAGAETVARIETEMDRYPHLFASQSDCDLYGWLQRIGCYSPIVHLQQTNGVSSSHLPFTAEYNAQGIVHPGKVLRAIARSYEGEPLPGLPPRCEEICLTFEIFPHTTDTKRDILPMLAESVRYWRQWIPRDGQRLDALIGDREAE
ncbi:MAG: TIM barrel protein [Spirochaetia bacterium]